MRDNRRVPVVRPLSYKTIELIAAKCHGKLRTGCTKRPTPVPIDRIIEFDMPAVYGYGLDVRRVRPGVHAYTDIGDRHVALGVDVYEELLQGVPRARFTAAHELGHVVLHAPQLEGLAARFVDGPVTDTFVNRKTIQPCRDPEWQANAYSSSFLMPLAAMDALANTRRGRLSVSQVARVFSTSKTASQLRLKIVRTKFGRNY